MARRTATFTVTSPGRDLGKRFHIEELSAVASETMLRRASQLLLRAGIEVPSGIFEAGSPAAFVALGLGALLSGLGKSPGDEVQSFMDDMMLCVTGYQETPNSTMISNLSVILGQIEEVTTLLAIREAIVSLHLGFSLRDRLDHFRALASEMIAADNAKIAEAN